jgi:1,4-dihydroxy-6-naphthoate synthase
VYGLEHQKDALDYSMQYSRGKPEDLIEKFVKMYVNDVTVDMGKSGEKSIRTFFDMAAKRELIPKFNIQIS